MTRQRVGRYLLQDVIGVGSFATVHRAVDERLDDVVVVKILAENHSLNPEIRERFIAEGRALRRVRSRHVVVVHDIGQSERQQPYLVLEHADRGTLADRLGALRARGWRADAQDVLAVGRQLAAALEAVHSAQLVHRDLSPTNVLLTSDEDAGTGRSPGVGARLVDVDERLLVADLGLCKDLAVSSGLTVAGGTSGYRPPEMDAGPAVIDTRADLWSLSALVRSVAEGADLPAALWQALDRGQSADPADRQPDAATWLHQVESALRPPASPVAPPASSASSSSAASAGPTDRHAPAPGPGSSRRRPWRRTLALTLAALLLGSGGGWMLRGSGQPPPATTSARLQIEAPEQVRVGEPATFTLRHLGVESWVWVLPTGTHVADAESISLTPTGSGTARVRVHAVDDAGRELQDVVEFSVGRP